MAGVESAASLFGSDDAGPDPFAALGSGEEEPVIARSSDHGRAYPEPHSVEAASNLFGEDEPVQLIQSWDPTSPDPYVYEPSSYSQDANTGTSYDDEQQQGWYDQHGQWQTNQYAPAAPATTAPVYDPYVPQSTVVSTPSYHSAHIPPPTQSAYAPYQPPVPVSTNSYAPPAPVQSTYDAPSAYGQSAYGKHVPEPNPSYSYPASDPYAQTTHKVPTIPPPPAPTASVYRPKTSNAYDPPMPPPKASKRAVSAGRPLRTVSPAVGQQTYPLYEVASLPPPPPLPAQYASYSVPQNAYSQGASQANGHGGPGVPSSGGYQPDNSWNNHNGEIHYSNNAGINHVQTNGPQIPPNGYASSQYHPHSDAHVTDDVPTPRLHGVVNNAWTQAQVQQAPYFEPAHDDAISGVADNWALTNSSRSPPLTHNGVIPRGSSPFKAPPSQSSEQYSYPAPPDGHSSINGSVVGRVASPPARSWYPRTSPDSHRAQDRKIVSPPPPSHHTYRSDPYDPTGRASPGVGSPDASPANVDIYGPPKHVTHTFGSSEPKVGSRVSSPAHTSNMNGYYDMSNIGVTPNAYEPLNKTISPSKNATSPSTAGGPYGPTTTYQPISKPSGTTSPPHTRQGQQGPPSDPYAPPPQATSYMSLPARDRSESNGSTFSATTAQPTRQPPFGNYAPAYGNSYNAPYEGLPYDSSAGGQDVSMMAPIRTAYAPSPSLLGSNDPLGRISARVPVFSFGFGGKMVTCFHGASSMTGGFDVALSARQSSDIQIRLLHKVVPESALDSSTAVFPGPLFSDPGSPTNSLVRTNASQVKAKKARVIKYLEERTDEIKHGISYLHVGTDDRKQADGKLVLVKLLKLMVENDGQVTGSAQIDSAVRAALLPRLADSSAPSVDSAPTALSTFSSIPEYSGVGLSSFDLNESPIAVSTLRPSALTKIQEFLLRGERRQAYHFALDQKLWAHAMVIASSIDKDAWKEVVNEFLRTELASGNNDNHKPTTDGREWLRVAYSLFSGQGAAAVEELKPPNQLSKVTGGLQVPAPALSHITPMSPHFPAGAAAAGISLESLSRWPETASAMISSPMAPDTSAALTALGDYLISNGWVEAAHACYMLSPITSPVGGIGAPSVRVVLIGSRSPHHWPSFHKDPDPIIFSEIAEFALSLAPPAKGQEPFHGLPHLQAYRLIRAMSLAEAGQNDLAKRYCEAITNSLGRNSQYFTAPFIEQLRGLDDRLTGAPHLDKSGWGIGGKMTKPSLDSIGGWLEGRLTKFIAGDGESPAPTQESTPDAPGVFSHYSTISSAATSASPSPTLSHVNPYTTLPGAPPRRTGSAMASPSSSPFVHIDRASSAMEYSRPDARKASPGPRIVASANASTTTFAQAPSFGQATNGYAPNGHVSMYSNDTVSAKPSLDTTTEEDSTTQTATWWGGSSYGADSTAPTPTMNTFVQVDEVPESTSSSGFISLMDSPSYSATPSPSVMSREMSSSYDDDDEDLGFGNSKKVKETKQAEIGGAAEPATSAAPARPDINPAPAAAATNGSWLGRFWKRSDAAPGPIKASLGEETSFYYDKELKRWVNKKAGGEDAAKPAAPPPPPSRSQTASPGHSGPFPSTPPSGPGASLGPPRSASSIDLSVSPPSNKSNLRVRSNLVPQESMSVPGTPMNGAPMGRPPLSAGLTGAMGGPGRPKSSASKRNIRSRYVDILQDGGA